DLLRDVGAEMLHEIGQLSFRGSGEQMEVVRREDEPKDLDVVKASGAGERPTDQRVRPLGRTHQETSLEAASRYKLNFAGNQHPQWPTHLTSFPTGSPLSTSRAKRANEVFDTLSVVEMKAVGAFEEGVGSQRGTRCGVDVEPQAMSLPLSVE